MLPSRERAQAAQERERIERERAQAASEREQAERQRARAASEREQAERERRLKLEAEVAQLKAELKRTRRT